MDEQLKEIQKLLDAADGNLTSARNMIRDLSGTCMVALDVDKKLENLNFSSHSDEGKVIEGVFDGENMVSPDGQTYPVPPNYASKSKLVEGDTLKLTISDDGSFIFKQIAPVDRRNAVGTLATADGGYAISAEGKSYKVLTASVTFYKAGPGDQVTIVLPKDHDANWAVLENVIKKASQEVVIDAEAEPEIVIPEPPMPTEEPGLPTAEPAPVVTEEKPEMIIPVPEAPMETPLSTTEQAAAPEVLETPAEPAEDTLAETPAPLETPAPIAEPEIEFPSGSGTLSDDQLLANLKENLKTLEQPQYTAPETVSAPMVPKPVDNIVANDLDKISAEPQKDKQIAELDI